MLKNLRLDMHVHSAWSPDGRMSLAEIAARVRAAGLDGAAVCDHDHTLPPGSWEDAEVLLIPGVEVSTERGHLLGWFVTKPIETRVFAEAAAAIHAQGGVAVLAHPFEHTRSPVRAEGAVPLLDGVEVWNSRAERKHRRANAMAESFAAAHGLRRFGGSDAHVPREIGNGVTLVSVDVPEGADRAAVLNAVKAALLAGDTAVEGRRSWAVDAARSQWTRRRKARAGLRAWALWTLFAVKCLGVDCLDSIGCLWRRIFP